MLFREFSIRRFRISDSESGFIQTIEILSLPWKHETSGANISRNYLLDLISDIGQLIISYVLIGSSCKLILHASCASQCCVVYKPCLLTSVLSNTVHDSAASICRNCTNATPRLCLFAFFNIVTLKTFNKKEKKNIERKAIYRMKNEKQCLSVNIIIQPF